MGSLPESNFCTYERTGRTDYLNDVCYSCAGTLRTAAIGKPCGCSDRRWMRLTTIAAFVAHRIVACPALLADCQMPEVGLMA